MAPVFSCFVRSLELKCEACYSKTRWQAQSATPRAMWHPRPRTDRRRPLQKGFVSAGKLTVTATGIAVDEKQLNSWARTNRPKKKKKTDMSVLKLKQQVARNENDAQFAAADRNRLRRSSSVAHLCACLDRGSEAWINSQDLLPFA